MQHFAFEKEDYIYRLRAVDPCGKVALNENFLVDTRNGFGRIFSDNEEFRDFMESPDKAKFNHPCSGPLLVQGAESDGSLAIRITNIIADKAYQCISRSSGIQPEAFNKRECQIFKVNSEGFIDYNGLWVRPRPSIGVLATLDDKDRSCGRCCENGGNLDFPFLSPGVTVYLPVNYPEALIAIGDVHLRQGFGEMPGMALETDATVGLQIGMTEKFNYPVIDTGNLIVIVGSGNSREEAFNKACENSIDYFSRQPVFKDWSKEKIYQFLANADLVPGNLTGKVPTYAVVIKKRDVINPVTGRTVFKLPEISPKEEPHDFKNILSSAIEKFSKLPIFHEGDSREIREIPEHPDLLIQRLKPTVYSHEAGGAVPADPETVLIRVKLDELFTEVLKEGGISLSNIVHSGEYILMKKEDVASRIEVAVKGAMIGSPKHIYKGITQEITRNERLLQAGATHVPYVRKDWRDKDGDNAMPDGLANHFIDVNRADQKALEAFEILNTFLKAHQLELLDCCFFMTKDGHTICSEVSPDNLGNIVYRGADPETKAVFADRSKSNYLNKLRTIAQILSNK